MKLKMLNLEELIKQNIWSCRHINSRRAGRKEGSQRGREAERKGERQGGREGGREEGREAEGREGGRGQGERQRGREGGRGARREAGRGGEKICTGLPILRGLFPS